MPPESNGYLTNKNINNSTLLGYTSLQLLWVEASELIHPRDRDRFAAAITSGIAPTTQRICV